MEKSIVWRYGVTCVGIKNRCRKTERHFSNKNELGHSIEMPSAEQAKAKALQWIAENMKQVKSASATLTAWEQNGQIETWNMFSDDHNKKFPLNFE